MSVERSLSALAVLAWLAAGIACVYGFHDLATFYDGFDIRQGKGVQYVHQAEVVFSAWYLLLGTLAVACVACALVRTALPQLVLRKASELLETPGRLVLLCALLTFSGSVLFRRVVLLDQPITDDELSYDFIAATLLEGRVVNTPPIAPEFLGNQFVIATEHAWYGKYPIGHPLLLALGRALHAQALVVPLLGALGLWLTFAVGRRVLDARRAALACVLLVLSPQYVWTHATQLSQPTSMVCMLLAMLGLLRLWESGELRWAALAAAALGFGILARPMPSGLFVLAALFAYVVQHGATGLQVQKRRRAVELLAIGAGVFAGVGGVLLVNYAQSGDPWTSGYHSAHGGTDALELERGFVAGSVGGALLRENFWLHGWPLSLALLPLARFGRGSVLVWGMLCAELAYRVVVPKTVVATTGPAYLLEVVPLLCLGTVAGLARVVELVTRAQVEPQRIRRAIVAAVLASTVVAAGMFVPVQLASIHRAAWVRAGVYLALADAGDDHALVFANQLVSPGAGVSWAFFPPNPSPALDDEQVFLRAPPGQDGYERMLKLWRARFPRRRPMLLSLTRAGLTLHPLPLAADAPSPLPLATVEPR